MTIGAGPIDAHGPVGVKVPEAWLTAVSKASVAVNGQRAEVS
jgi:hypothetical protein